MTRTEVERLIELAADADEELEELVMQLVGEVLTASILGVSVLVLDE